MIKTTTLLSDFWPSLTAVSETLETQAQTQDPALFLAVHQPMRFALRPVGSGVSQSRTEHDLLKALLAKPGPAKTVILPILGDSGVGKSHAVRWLSEQLKISADPRLHVVWVPRGESLKQTLRRVLTAFEGSTQHAELKNALDTANELSAGEVRGRLRSAIVEQLLNPSDELKERIGADLSEFAEDCGRGLAALLQDPASSWDHFETVEFDPDGGRGAISRLARHITDARAQEDDRGATDRKFVPRDLDIAPAIQKRMGILGYDFCGQLQSNDEIHAASVALLNEVLDSAKSRSLELGGVDLLDLFRQFRASLQSTGRELVFLIEDFTVMSGLQGALYDLMVQTPQAGEQDICALRTAFALTPGYMQGQNLPENVRTRAGAEWHVSGGRDSVEKLENSIDLVAAYLNAARVGVDQLRHNGPDIKLEPSDEMPEDDRAILSAFGMAGNQHWLFPFNRNALEVLMNLHMPDADYNPRLLLRNVVRPILEQRSLFEQKSFPSAETGEDPAADVGAKITARVPAASLRRYLKLVHTWGGRPRRWSEVELLPRELFVAFGLEPLEGLKPAAGLSTGPSDLPEPVRPPGPTVIETGGEVKEFPELEEWRTRGTRLRQATAATLRRHIAEWTLSSMPAGWPGLRVYSAGELQKLVYIPRAPGTLTPEDAFVCFARDEELEDPAVSIRLERELSAVLRWSSSDGTPNYPGGREDFPLIRALIHRLRDAAATWLRNHPLDFRRSQNPTKELVQIHLFLDPLRGRVAGAQRKSRVKALFPSFVANPTSAEAWDNLFAFLDEQFSGRSTHGFSEALYLLTCSFQGSTGKTPFAFDVASVWEEISTIENGLPTTFGVDAAPGSPAAAELEKHLKRLRLLLQNVESEVAVYNNGASELLEWTGGLPNSAVLGGLLNLTTQALAQGLAPESATQVRNLIPALSIPGARSITDNARAIGAIRVPFDSESLEALQKVDFNTLTRAVELRATADLFLQELEESVNVQAPAEETQVEGAVRRITLLLDEIQLLLRENHA